MNARSDLIKDLKVRSTALFSNSLAFSRFLATNDLSTRSFYEGTETRIGWWVFKKKFLV